MTTSTDSVKLRRERTRSTAASLPTTAPLPQSRTPAQWRDDGAEEPFRALERHVTALSTKVQELTDRIHVQHRNATRWRKWHEDISGKLSGLESQIQAGVKEAQHFTLEKCQAIDWNHPSFILDLKGKFQKRILVMEGLLNMQHDQVAEQGVLLNSMQEAQPGEGQTIVKALKFLDDEIIAGRPLIRRSWARLARPEATCAPTTPTRRTSSPAS